MKIKKTIFYLYQKWTGLPIVSVSSINSNRAVWDSTGVSSKCLVGDYNVTCAVRCTGRIQVSHVFLSSTYSGLYIIVLWSLRHDNSLVIFGVVVIHFILETSRMKWIFVMSLLHVDVKWHNRFNAPVWHQQCLLFFQISSLL